MDGRQSLRRRADHHKRPVRAIVAARATDRMTTSMLAAKGRLSRRPSCA